MTVCVFVPLVSRLIVIEHRMVDQKFKKKNEDKISSHGRRSSHYRLGRKWNSHKFSGCVVFSYHVITIVAARRRMRIDSSWYGISRHFPRECIVWEFIRNIVWYWGICVVTIRSTHRMVPRTTFPWGWPLAAVICRFTISPSISSIVLLPF